MGGAARCWTAPEREAAMTFHGWRVLGAMMTVRGVGGGINLYGSSLFVIPIQADLGISRGVISTLFAVGLLVRHLGSPLSGRLIDRLGARRMLLFTLLLSGTGYIALAGATNVVVLFAVYVGLVSLGFHVLLFQAPSVIINNWFDRRKALAMSLLQVGAGVGGAIIVPLLGLAIIWWDWRVASVLAGVALLLVGLPALIVTRDTPEELGELPDGDRAAAHSGAPQGPSAGTSLREAMRTPAYWLIALTMMTFSSAAGAVGFHFVPILDDKGISEAAATGLLGTFALLSVPVIVFTGWLGDRFNRLKVSAGMIVAVGVGIVVLNLGESIAAVGAAALLMAGTQGVYPLLWAATGEAFGRRGFGAIRGSVEGFLVLGLAAPALFGFLHDWQGDYRVALWIASGLCVVSATVAMVTAGRLGVRRVERSPQPAPAG